MLARRTPSKRPEAASTPAAQDPSRALLEAPTVAPAPTPRAPSELQLLLAARRELATDPGAALRRVEEHEERFADGTLAPEREVLAIRALKALGRSEVAEQRLKRFRASYPESAHLRPDF